MKRSTEEQLNAPAGRAQRRLHNVWLHDVADRLRLRRQAIASADGLDPRDVEPFPMHGDVTIIQQPASGGWKTVGAVLLALTGAGALGAGLALPAQLANLFGTAAQNSAKQNGEIEPQEFRVTFWTEEGEPIEVEQK